MTVDMLVDNAAYASFALVSFMLLVPRARFVRVLVALFAGVWLAHTLLTARDQTTIVWMSVLLGIALLLMIADLFGHRRTRLSAEEQELAARLLPGASRSSVRHFIDQGFWLNGKTGDLLMQEGETVRHLYYLGTGEARVVMTGKQVGSCRAGDLLGEAALFNGETAIATVALAGPARFWCAPAERLRPYLDVHTQLRRALERGISDVAKAAAHGEPAPGDGTRAAVAA